ncbi:hypothetical protein M427DRAFT_337396 [Gonapodya prolifera JEL478]|uniref:Uncharacterized protein n=1 Tax=Gonapodya prolifera (strain JEL478) TaxID=1344416 RepID=A0A139AE63_GONPJ|nr:hypothetical protein M427DRAFT_337396 [Gonapodya prolifera JEL478]|eukprot:KXS14725.1 hypothetical protein M427DRAFT_337396 [Gonapodya prolifera JEL478]
MSALQYSDPPLDPPQDDDTDLEEKLRRVAQESFKRFKAIQATKEARLKQLEELEAQAAAAEIEWQNKKDTLKNHTLSVHTKVEKLALETSESLRLAKERSMELALAAKNIMEKTDNELIMDSLNLEVSVCLCLGIQSRFGLIENASLFSRSSPTQPPFRLSHQESPAQLLVYGMSTARTLLPLPNPCRRSSRKAQMLSQRDRNARRRSPQLQKAFPDSAILLTSNAHELQRKC